MVPPYGEDVRALMEENKQLRRDLIRSNELCIEQAKKLLDVEMMRDNPFRLSTGEPEELATFI